MRSRRPKVGLVTADLRLASRVRRLLGEYDADLVHVADPRDMPLDVGAVIAKRGEGLLEEHGRALYFEDFGSVEELVEKAVELAITGSDYMMVAVAIDPGKSPGVAYLIDNKLLKTRRYGLVEEMVDDVGRFIESHSKARRRYVIIGSSTSFENVKEILRKLEKKLRDRGATIIVCDESFTSRGLLPKLKGMSKDEYSALILSLKNLIRLG